jgi:catechol 2,3-dioxygenase-like lactoylglutathione lyase family enzyme
MGIYVADLARMEDFYTRVLGFAVTDRGELGALTNPINQVAFRLAELADLRTWRARITRRIPGR